MSPLFTQPNRGYADYQRVGNYDTGVLFQDLAVHPGGSLLTPVIDVSRFAYLTGRVNTGTGQQNMAVSYYLDSAASIAVGGRQLTLDSRIGQLLVPHFQNQGPFMTIQWVQVGGGALSTNIVIAASNRPGTLESLPSQAWVVNQVNTPIGAGITVDTFANYYYSGPMQVAVWASNANMALLLNAFDPFGAAVQLDVFPIPVASVWQRLQMTAPSGAWKLGIQNSGAAGNFYLNVTPTTTGST